MDLLFERYASPFLLLDVVITNCNFFKWLCEFVEQVGDTKLWEVWLHKVDDKSFNDYKQSVITATQIVDKEQLKETVINSKSMLKNFKL